MARHKNELYVTVPSLFRCPISMDVMKSPVSLCTGVTYDRSSITTWLNSGHNTCPATAQILHSTDIIPNLTLRSLIRCWNNSLLVLPDSPAASLHNPQSESITFSPVNKQQILQSLRNVVEKKSEFYSSSVSHILEFAIFSEENIEFVLNYEGFVTAIVEVFDEFAGIEVLELAILLFEFILFESREKQKLIVELYRCSMSPFVTILRKGKLNSRISSAKVLELISRTEETRNKIIQQEKLLAELFNLLNSETDQKATDAAISALITVTASKFVKTELIRFGIRNVAQTIPSYAMSVFLLPLEITKEIERVLSKYWWSSGSDHTSSIHWMSWERLSRHKVKGGMGFRNFRDFNLAMLAKQGWRLCSNNNSLVSRVFKARYFENGNFLTAELGSNPSFVWRSILEAKDIIKEGARWMVVSGENIDICNQPWVQDESNPYITSDNQAIQQNKVSSLMGIGTRRWDEEIVGDLFNDRDQRCILSTKVHSRVTEDTMYWSKETSGVYSVKSAYRMLQEKKHRWSNRDEAKLWKIMWRIKAPAKVLNLVWRAASGLLPVLDSLKRRHVPVVSTCHICDGVDETTLHALVTCPRATHIWSTLIPNIQQYIEGDFFDWLSGVLELINQERRALVVTVSWAIWKARNEKVWNKKNSSANSVLYSAKSYLIQWRETQSRSFMALPHAGLADDGASSWVKPQEFTIKVNVDAALFHEHGSVGAGMVARNFRGELIQAKTVLSVGVVQPELAETMAIKEALSWMERNGWHEGTIETDCLVAAQAIRSRIQMNSPFGVVVEECRNLLCRLNKISLLFVRRSANMAAHYVAKMSCSFPDRSFSGGDVPVELNNVMLGDLMI